MDFLYVLCVLLGLLVGLVGGGWVFYRQGRILGTQMGEESGFQRGSAERQTLDDRLQREAQQVADEIKRVAFERATETRVEADRFRLEAEQVRESALHFKREAERDAARLIEEARSRVEFEAEQVRSSLNAERESVVRERLGVRSERDEMRGERDELKRELERLNRRAEQLDARGLKLDQLEERVTQEHMLVQEQSQRLEERLKAVENRLYEVAGLDTETARQIVLSTLEDELEEERAVRIKISSEKLYAEAKKKAQSIVSQAIQRCASETSAVMSVSVVPIPSDAMKGRIIGREGRNIRAFEQLTGVDLIIDDTPEAVILSSFNPIRREVAKHALEQLVQDGRIHPSRIEEVVHRAQEDMKAFIHHQGEEGALEAGVIGLKPGLLQLLGRMYFRTSYGQNILKHSIQVAHLTGLLAAELELDETLARRCGLLHDVGKSIDREIEGTHVDIGISLAKRFGEPLEVVDAIAHHHDPENSETLYGVLVAAADAISAARPGARRESLETYIRRLEQLETIALSFPGVAQAYAIQAGREVRVVVQPEKISDSRATLLAREIAGRIEQDMEYPGQVQVTVLRESRVVEYAK